MVELVINRLREYYFKGVKMEEKKLYQKIESFLIEKKEKEIFEEIEKFHNERVSKIEKDKTSIPLREGAKIVLQLIPVNSFLSQNHYDLSQFYREYSSLKLMRGSGHSQGYNFDGLIHFREIIDDRSYGYVQLFTNGIIEAVDVRSSDSLERTDMSLQIYKLENQIVIALKEYLIFQKEKLKIKPPIIFYLSLLKVKKCSIHIPGPNINIDPEYIHDFGIDTLDFPKIIIKEFNIAPEKILKITFDRLWNAAGYPRSFHYGDKGEWVEK